MGSASDPRAADWLGACRRSVGAIRGMLGDHPTIAARLRETGTRGEGGDRTLLIDEAAEGVGFAELDKLHAAGARFTAVSEERGVVDFGSEDVRVVIDPIDGSTNAKRGLPHFALSVAVAHGETMADVVFGFVQDFGPREEWVAWRGRGAQLDGVPLDPGLGERRTRDGKLEVIGVESADPRWVMQSADALAETAHRMRAIGAIAVSLCQVAAARFDAMASLKRCRAVDAAAAQLIVREAGGLVSFIAFDDPLSAPLDLEGHSPVIAARTEAGLADVAKIPVWPQSRIARTLGRLVGVIVWNLAGTVARGVANLQPAGAPAPFEQLAGPAEEAERLVSAYTRLVPAQPVPAAEAVDRSSWIEANLAGLAGGVGPAA